MKQKLGRIKVLPFNGGLDVTDDLTQVSSEIDYRMCAKKVMQDEYFGLVWGRGLISGFWVGVFS